MRVERERRKVTERLTVRRLVVTGLALCQLGHHCGVVTMATYCKISWGSQIVKINRN